MGSPSAKHVHLIADLHDCSSGHLRDRPAIESALRGAAKAAGATVVDTTFYKFPGGGITGVVTVKESHLSIHTWPELNYAAVDIFLCGRTQPHAALEYIKKKLRPAEVEVREQRRGARESERKSKDKNTPARMDEEISHEDPVGENSQAGSVPTSRRRMPVLYLLTLTVAACSIIYELLLAQTLSALLGNTVLRYSVTIGAYLGALGLGAMLCSHDPPNAHRKLMRTELALSAVGGIAVPLFYFMDTVQRYFYFTPSSATGVMLHPDSWAPIAFLIGSHFVIVAIGLLSGFEVPLLLALGRQRRRDSTNLLLGIDYLGALVGSVLFPILLLRHLGLFATGFLVATLNATACTLITLLHPERRSYKMAAVGMALAGVLLVGLSRSSDIEQFFLRKFYFSSEISSFKDLVTPRDDRPTIQRYRSFYQTIDIFRAESVGQWAYNLASTKHIFEPDYPQDVRLYLNRDFQVYSGLEEIYHEWFVHAPIQAAEHPPRRALVLGGGDGLVVRELLSYPGLEEVVHVELDKEMLRIAEEHPQLARMNQTVYDESRVRVEAADAFSWLRRSTETFDAVYVDMPYPRDYNLAQVYSREFYTLIRQRLAPGGFLALDAPDGSCGFEGSLWPVYYNTLRAAGFDTVMPVVSRFDLDAEPIFSRVLDLASRVRLRSTNDERDPSEFSQEKAFEYLRSRLGVALDRVEQEFLLAFPTPREPNLEWTDYEVPLYALREEHFSLAFDNECDTEIDPDQVNSVFRPLLPPLKLVDVQIP